ncbi:hypothetical protein [Pseudomonas aegrilactucae]|uniref:Uncharacterized protein n=1 Tax=Pseudomonas aegrilactucae TaxID=2854028 RepID=A0A9Q2XLQ0_9PSED|nr:hypothetical protein [Pseudomonas aegrilactucae]MBV6288537.1 hypothetical protein [Pseudomonas aegrilactucae]
MPVLPTQVNLDDWTTLDSEEAVNQLINTFGGFSDCILTRHESWGECHVDDDLCIVYPPPAFAADQKLRATFERQSAHVKSVELLFLGLKCLQVIARDAHRDGIINTVRIERLEDGDLSFVASAQENAEGIFSATARSILWREA